MAWLLGRNVQNDSVGDFADGVICFPAMWKLDELAKIADFLKKEGAHESVRICLGEAWIEWSSGAAPPFNEPPFSGGSWPRRKPIESWAHATRPGAWFPDSADRIRALKAAGISPEVLHLEDPDAPQPVHDDAYREGPDDPWAKVEVIKKECAWFADVYQQEGAARSLPDRAQRERALALASQTAPQLWSVIYACKYSSLDVKKDGLPVTCHAAATRHGGSKQCRDCKHNGKLVGPFQIGRDGGKASRPELLAIVDDAVARAPTDAGAALSADVITSAAMLSADAPDELARIRQRLRFANVPLRPFDGAVRDEAKRHSAAKAYVKGRTVEACLGPNAPGARLVLPPRFVLTPGAVNEINGDGESVAITRGPIFLTGRFKDMHDGTEHVRVSWARAGRWGHRTVPRLVICDARQLVTLAGFGVPVAGHNAAGVVRWLYEFEAANEKLLPTAHITSTLGWQPSDKGFLWGTTHLGVGGAMTSVDVERSDPATWPKNIVAFHSSDAGAAQLISGYHAAGTWEGWLAVVAKVSRFPHVMTMIYAALSAALLFLLKIEGFVTDLAGRSSTGKTTVMRGAASTCGRPEESAVDGVIYSWDSTTVWMERAAATTSDHPLFTDDTKRAKKPEDVAQAIYTIAQGRGRGRGSKTGFAQATTWRVIMLSTGEAPATSFTQDGGSRTRVMSLTGLPFGGDDEQTRQLVDDVNSGFKNHYGHAYPRFVRWLLMNKGSVETWRARHAQLVAEFVASGTASGPAARMANHAAAVTLAGELFHEAFSPPWAYSNPLTTLWPDVVARAVDADMAARALDAVLSWAFSNRDSFWSARQSGAPHGGWSGRWDAAGTWGYVGIFPHVLKRVLVDCGFRFEEVLSSWMERDYLETDKEARRGKKVTLGGEEVRLYCVRRSVIDALRLNDSSAAGSTDVDPEF